MLQPHTNWPGAYRESLLFSSLVFWDVKAEGGQVGKGKMGDRRKGGE